MGVQEAEGRPEEAAGDEAEEDQRGGAEGAEGAEAEAGEVHHSHEGQGSKVREWNIGEKPRPLGRQSLLTEKLTRVTVIRKMSLARRKTSQTSVKVTRMLKTPQKMRRPTAKQLPGLI